MMSLIQEVLLLVLDLLGNLVLLFLLCHTTPLQSMVLSVLLVKKNSLCTPTIYSSWLQVCNSLLEKFVVKSTLNLIGMLIYLELMWFLPSLLLLLVVQLSNFWVNKIEYLIILFSTRSNYTSKPNYLLDMREIMENLVEHLEQ